MRNTAPDQSSQNEISQKLADMFNRRPAVRRRHSIACTCIPPKVSTPRLVVVMDTANVGLSKIFQVIWKAHAGTQE